MKFAFIPVGSDGDVNPFLGLATAMQSRGHDVRVVTNPVYRPKIERLNLQAMDVGTLEDYQAMVSNPDLWKPKQGVEILLGSPLMLKTIREHYAVIAKLYAEDPNVIIVAGTLALAARMAEEKLGVRTATVHLQPVALRSVLSPPAYPRFQFPENWPRWLVRAMFWLIDRGKLDRLLDKTAGVARKELGLPRHKHYMIDDIHAQRLSIGLFPKWYASAADWPPQFQQTGFPRFDAVAAQLSDNVEAYLQAGEPPIVFTFGTGMAQAKGLLTESAEACRLMNRRGILLTKFADQVPGNLPPGVVHFDYVPLTTLMPRCAAIVHHGGIGTTSQALAGGVPQVITPFGFDQMDNAYRLQKLGVGDSLLPQTLKGEQLAQTLTSLLNRPATLAACRDVQKHFENEDVLGDTCRLLESLGTPAK